MESNFGMPSPEGARSAADQLASLDLGRAALADRLVTPWWYHPVLGVLLGGLVLAYGTLPINVLTLALLPYFGGLWLLARAYQAKTGIWLSGWTIPAGRPWALALAVVGAGCMLLALVAHWAGWGPMVPASAAGLAFAATVVGGWQYDRAIRADLRSSR
jgi:hypothetical protein